jgi:hypothetical protein
MFSSLNTDKNSRNNKGKFLFSGENNFLTTSYKHFGRTQTNDKNYSEKKKRMIIKEKILEKQNNDVFLLDIRDIKHKNKIRKFKNVLLSSQGSNQTLTTNRNTPKRNEPKIKSLSKQKPNIYYFSKDFFVDKIKQALYNNSLAKNPFKRKNMSRINNEGKLMYINMFVNTNNYASEKILLPKNEKNLNKKVNKSVGIAKKKIEHIYIKNKNNNIIDDEAIKTKNKYEYNFRKIKQKIKEYNQKEKVILDKLKLHLNKMQNEIKLSSSYYTERQKLIESQKELNLKENNDIY